MAVQRQLKTVLRDLFTTHVRHAFVVDDERLVRALESAGGRMKAKPSFIYKIGSTTFLSINILIKTSER